METFTAPATMNTRVRRNGVMVCAFFGLGWFIGGAGILGGGALYWIGIAAAALVSLGLVGAVPRVATRRGREREMPKDWARRYGFWVGFEVVLILAAVFGLSALDAVDFLPGTVAVIVGAHLVPLARAFDEPRYKWAGSAMAAAGVAGVVAGLGGVEVGGAVAGFGSALVLWTAGYSVLRNG